MSEMSIITDPRTGIFEGDIVTNLKHRHFRKGAAQLTYVPVFSE
jgi:hypothetical protein